MSLTRCNRCHSESEVKQPNEECLKSNAFQDGPCHGRMLRYHPREPLSRTIDQSVEHLLRLENMYADRQKRELLLEVRANRVMLQAWRKTL